CSRTVIAAAFLRRNPLGYSCVEGYGGEPGWLDGAGCSGSRQWSWWAAAARVGVACLGPARVERTWTGSASRRVTPRLGTTRPAATPAAPRGAARARAPPGPAT